MAASTETCRGYGASKGKYKPENNCGGCHCGCGKPAEPFIVRPMGCYVRNKVGQRAAYISPSMIPVAKVCS